MITGYRFTDTEDDIRPTTPAEDAAYRAEGEEIKEDAEALLATVRHLLTGAEIDTLDAAAAKDGSAVNMVVLDSIRLQFYAQMCNYKDRRATA